MKIVKSLILLFFIAACGPVYQTNYEIIPPQDDMGRMCANNCLLSKQNCEQSCQMQEMTCRSQARLESQNDYLQYVAVQNAKGKPVARNQQSFTRYYNCDQNFCYSNCMSNYHVCHTNCGGQVIPHTYCAANCN